MLQSQKQGFFPISYWILSHFLLDSLPFIIGYLAIYPIMLFPMPPHHLSAPIHPANKLNS